jgi:hypothetical protein
MYYSTYIPHSIHQVAQAGFLQFSRTKEECLNFDQAYFLQ